MKIKSRIVLNQLALSVNLGWPKGERTKQQTVAIDITIEFNEPPAACISDQLTDTYCYDDLINVIKTKIEGQNFRLLEHLGYTLYHTIKEIVSPAHVQVKITKKPSIANLQGGVTFCYGDR